MKRSRQQNSSRHKRSSSPFAAAGRSQDDAAALSEPHQHADAVVAESPSKRRRVAQEAVTESPHPADSPGAAADDGDEGDAGAAALAAQQQAAEEVQKQQEAGEPDGVSQRPTHPTDLQLSALPRMQQQLQSLPQWQEWQLAGKGLVCVRRRHMGCLSWQVRRGPAGRSGHTRLWQGVFLVCRQFACAGSLRVVEQLDSLRVVAHMQPAA